MLSLLSFFLAIYLLLVILLQISDVQREIGGIVSKELSSLLKTEVSIGRIDIGLLNRIIITDLSLKDDDAKEMARISRLSAKFEILPLFNKKVRIGSVQLFGFDFKLSKENKDAPLNIQYIIDAFKRKDDAPKSSWLDLKINTVLVRRGRLSYDVMSEPDKAEGFDVNHIGVENIIATVSLKLIRNDSIDVNVKRFSFREKSGFVLDRLAFRLKGGNGNLVAENFKVKLDKSELDVPLLEVKYPVAADSALADVLKDASFRMRLVSENLYSGDFAFLSPSIADAEMPFDLSAAFSGSAGDVRCDEFRLLYGNDFILDATGGLSGWTDMQSADVSGRIVRLYSDKKALGDLFGVFGIKMPAQLANLDYVDVSAGISGKLSNLKAEVNVLTPLGDVKSGMSMVVQGDGRGFEGHVSTEVFGLGHLLASEKFGNISFGLQFSSLLEDGKLVEAALNGAVDDFYFHGYEYGKLALDFTLADETLSGNAALHDRYGLLDMDVSVSDVRKNPALHLALQAGNINPYGLQWTERKEYENADFSLSLAADLAGKDLETLAGNVTLSDFSFNYPDRTFLINSFELGLERPSATEKLITVESDFMSSEVRGNFSYAGLPQSLMWILRKHLPEEGSSEEEDVPVNNNLTFNLDVYDTGLLSEVLNVPLYLHGTAAVNGYLSDSEERFRLEAYVPDFRFKDNWFESASLVVDNQDASTDLQLRSNIRMKKGSALACVLNVEADGNDIKTRANWGNDAVVTYCGELDAEAVLGRSDGLDAEIKINRSDIIFNDTVWTMFPSEISVGGGKLQVRDFEFGHDGQHVKINGVAGKELSDSLFVDLKDIDVAYIFNIADIKKTVDLSGSATGYVRSGGVLSQPNLETVMHIDNFSLNGSRLGDLDLNGGWDNDRKAIILDGYATDYDIGDITVKGVIHPIKPNGRLDLRIQTNHANLGFLQFYMKSISSDVRGRASGNVRIFGPFKKINIEGDVLAHDASFKVDILNTSIHMSDSVHFRPGDIQFRNVTVSDAKGNTGVVNGNVYHNYLKDLSFRIRANLDNMLVFDTKESPDVPFFGTVYASGNLELTGGHKYLDVNAWMTTGPDSRFYYLTETTAMAEETKFITFVDKTPKIVRDTIVVERSAYDEYMDELSRMEETASDIRLNLVIDATPDAEMRIIMDPRAGDYIGGRGTGNIRVEFFNKGDVKLFGNYSINQGIYKFSLQDVIRKDFVIMQGSNITFNGHPLDADLSIDATYTVNSASLNDLGTDVAEQAGQTNVKVACLMSLTGNLAKPSIRLGLELPDESEEVERTVLNAISTDELMNMEILYLLGLGKFYTPDYVNPEQSSNALSSVISSTLSEQFNNALSSIINNSNWNVGTNLSTGGNGWTDVEFEGMLSGQLLNNRLLINGNFGYRENSMTQSNFIGDFDIEYLLTRDGGLRIKAYNKTNDRYYTRTTLTTQGIGFVYKKDFMTWRELASWLRLRKHRPAAKDSVTVE